MGAKGEVSGDAGRECESGCECGCRGCARGCECECACECACGSGAGAAWAAASAAMERWGALQLGLEALLRRDWLGDESDVTRAAPPLLVDRAPARDCGVVTAEGPCDEDSRGGKASSPRCAWCAACDCDCAGLLCCSPWWIFDRSAFMCESPDAC